LVASVAWPLATAVAKRTQQLHGVNDVRDRLLRLDGTLYACGLVNLGNYPRIRTILKTFFDGAVR
jgi:hypothetical protein